MNKNTKSKQVQVWVFQHIIPLLPAILHELNLICVSLMKLLYYILRNINMCSALSTVFAVYRVLLWPIEYSKSRVLDGLFCIYGTEHLSQGGLLGEVAWARKVVCKC